MSKTTKDEIKASFNEFMTNSNKAIEVCRYIDEQTAADITE